MSHVFMVHIASLIFMVLAFQKVSEVTELVKHFIQVGNTFHRKTQILCNISSKITTFK